MHVVTANDYLAARDAEVAAHEEALAALREALEKLSLNDIEHRVLRPIWDDPRVHYALNCAALSLFSSCRPRRWISGGRIDRPVRETLFSGNAFEALGRIVALGSGARRLGGGRVSRARNRRRPGRGA